MDAAIVIGGIRYSHPILNAARTCSTVEDVTALAASAVAGITVGPVTYAPNAENEGLMYYRRQLREMVRAAAEHGKPLSLSVAGSTVAEYIELAGLALDNKTAALELDVSGDRAWLGSIAARDPKAIAKVIEAARRYLRLHVIGVTLTPCSDAGLRQELAAMLGEAPIQYVVVRAETPLAEALDYVRELRQLLPLEMQVVSAGGIETAVDVHAFLAAGASAVQVEAAHLSVGQRPSFFDELVRDVALPGRG
ncbi:MAG TPA: hypothetical protein VLI05_07265 [Candidatus Saccharimonadia bacterium]|nr:hypothetical protein [Candidatus Saccharimonadia bacterium]